jgi:TPP-dependent pyruvate/acetoin dehydrogenase alpha subunit
MSEVNSDATITSLYSSLYRIRRVEQEIVQVYPKDKIKSPIHLSIGQEAVSVGVCEALDKRDSVFGTYRSHALYLAKGGDLNAMIAELYGKITGCAKGQGGSMHLSDIESGMVCSSAVVASTIPIAVGYANAAKYKKEDRVVASFLGDGATEEGVFFESINYAALKNLPIIFVCENNGYAIHTSHEKRQSNTDICGKVESFGLPVERIEDNDILEIYRITKEHVTRIREKQFGPLFLECATYRLMEHVGPGKDFNLGYRTESEAEPWVANDQIDRLAVMLNDDSRRRLEECIEKEISLAFEFAEASDFPSPEQPSI